MNRTIVDLLNRISSNQYKAYVVGGYVRDLILGLDNNDIDIVTNAPVDFLLSEFSEEQPKQFKYGTIKFKFGQYSVDIAQIRREIYDGNITNVECTNNLRDDYLRRDFTFNAIYVDKDGNFYDFDNCVSDCKNLKLKFIFDANKKCIEDPTRLLRAFYFILKYNIEDYNDLSNVTCDLIDFNKCNIHTLNTVLYKILKLGKQESFINLLIKYNIYDKLFDGYSSTICDTPMEFLKESNYKYLDSSVKNSN